MSKQDVITKEESEERAAMEAKELATMEAEMIAEGDKLKEDLAAAGNRISNSGKQFTLPNGEAMGPTLDVVILGYQYASAFYEGAYDSKNPQGPVCFAKSSAANLAQIKPAKEVAKPESETCATCPNDAFDSAPVGKGKACKNEIQVHVALPDNVNETMILAISATGIKGFKSSLSGILNGFGHTAKAIVKAEFTDAMYPVVKLTGGVANPRAIEHFKLSKGVTEDLAKLG